MSSRLGASIRIVASAIAAAGALLGLNACTVVSSEALHDISRSQAAPAGIYYSLPMALVDVSLYVIPESAEFRLVVGPEHYVADPAQRYLMRYHPLPNYKDNIEVEVSSSSIISKVWSTTEDKTDEIVVDLAKAARSLLPQFQSGRAMDNALKLGTVTIDPSDPKRVAEAASYFNGRLVIYAAAVDKAACRGRADTTCQLYAKYKDPQRRTITIKVEPPAPVGPATAAADCTVGLCYRIKEPYLVSWAVDGVRGATIVYVPNRSPLVELDVRRAVFVQKIQKIEFDKDGFLKSAYVKKDSEVLAVAQLPVGVLTAVSEALPVRLTIQQRQVDVAQKRLAEIEARRNLAATRAEAAGGAAQTVSGPQSE